jgi:hypothetical protein
MRGSRVRVTQAAPIPHPLTFTTVRNLLYILWLSQERRSLTSNNVLHREYLGFRFKVQFQAECIEQEIGDETYYALDRNGAG